MWYTCDSTILKLSMYNSFRAVCRGGGVAMLAKNYLDCVILSDYCKATRDYEVLTLVHNRTMFPVCYRPPEGSLTNLFDFFNRFFGFINDNRYLVIFGGNYNIDICWEIIPIRTM